MAKKSEMKFKDYPECSARSSGCKVGWRYYLSEADAKKAAEIAKYNAEISMRLGFDFGYCSPGEIIKCGPEYRNDYAGLYEVCVP